MLIINLFIYSFVYLFIYSFIHLFIHLFIYIRTKLSFHTQSYYTSRLVQRFTIGFFCYWRPNAAASPIHYCSHLQRFIYTSPKFAATSFNYRINNEKKQYNYQKKNIYLEWSIPVWISDLKTKFKTIDTNIQKKKTYHN